MIKKYNFLVRKEGMSHEEFVKEWTEGHAALVRAFPGMTRYVQHYWVTPGPRWSDRPTADIHFDGIAETWFETPEAMELCGHSPEQRIAGLNTKRFVSKSKVFVMEQNVVVPSGNSPE